MLKLTGYSDRIYARPGDTLRFMVNCDGPKSYRAEIVRVICGDTNPEGPGFKEQVVETPVNRRYKGRKQEIRAGSYIVVPSAPALDCLRSFSAQAYIWPTTPLKGPQSLISKWASRTDTGFALMIDERGCVALRLGAGRDRIETISTGEPLLDRQWYMVAASYDATTGIVSVLQEMQRELPGWRRYVQVNRRIGIRDLPATDRPLLMAAIEGQARHQAMVVHHFNGKIDRPRLANRVCSAQEMAALWGEVPAGLQAAVVGIWDFARDISSERITDLSPNRLHGETVNLPARAMTGANWTGEVMDWRVRPQQWGAIHFHDDDIYDAGWDVDFELPIPDGLRSSLYAARLRADNHEEYIPFAIGPKPNKEAPVAFLLPTASYLAYANEHIAVDSPTAELTCNLVCEIYPRDVFLNEHREYGGSLYDLHSDGSGVCYSSRLRPVLNMRPKQQGALGGSGSRLWQFNADTHITDWLKAMGHRYDVITDEELHARGLELLQPYRAILTGTHPEYWSMEMWNAMDAYKTRGGRLIYLGGNGFYWRVAYHPTKPGVIELRRNEGGIRAWFAQPGEYHHSVDGGYGGLWLNQGRAPQAMVGVGMCSQGFDISGFYRRKPDSLRPEMGFIFAGIAEDEPIGDFGLIGGGAAGLEIDRLDHRLGTPRNAYLLASSEGLTDTYVLTVEELPETYPGLGAREQGLVRADMVFFRTPNGGAVFSVGSMAWAGSLSHNNYKNNVSRVTDNVLRRFIDPAPL
jgi:N,N-dimethylformamidase beta subunit-like, C-terminal/Concanavalin A-like lectin/glucanases superfamily